MEAEQQATELWRPVLSVCSGLLFPLSSWYLEGMQETWEVWQTWVSGLHAHHQGQETAFLTVPG